MIAAWPGPDGIEYAVALDRSREHRLLVLPALFEESNKLRHLTVEVMRRLDETGIDTMLPDLPGCNESAAPLEAQTLDGWRAAAAAAAAHFSATAVLSVRAGVLCEPPYLPGVRYAPVPGPLVLRSLLRARVLASKEAGKAETREALAEEGRIRGIALAGYRVGPRLFAQLEHAEAPPRPGVTDIPQVEVGGAGLWLRAEPAHDPEQAERLAQLVAEAIAG